MFLGTFPIMLSLYFLAIVLIGFSICLAPGLFNLAYIRASKIVVGATYIKNLISKNL